MADPNSNFSELASATIADYSEELADNVTNNIPFFAYLKKGGMLKKWQLGGGTEILENIEYGDNATFKWYNGYEELSVVPSNILTTAQFSWKECNANTVYSLREAMINAGDKTRMHDFITAKAKNSEKAITNNLGVAVYYSNTENDGKSIGGLQFIVADDPTTGTVGNINRGTAGNEWWRNQVLDFSNEGETASPSSIQEMMGVLYRRCTRGVDQPGLIILGETYYRYYDKSLMAAQMWTNQNKPDAGIVSTRFLNAEVIWDNNCSATRGYFLNLDYFKLRAHRLMNMKPGDKKMPTNQNAVIIPINWMGNITCSNASLQGVMHG